MPSDKYVWYDKLGDRYGVLPGFDNGLKVVNLFETKEYEDYLNKVHSWFKAGYINKDAATSQASGSDLLKADKAFSYFIGLRPGNLESEIRASGERTRLCTINAEHICDYIRCTWGIVDDLQ